MSTPPAGSLLHFLTTVPDPRSRYGRRHPLSAMLAAVCCAILCGARGFKPIAQWVHDQDITLMHALGFTRTPPKWGAFRKLLIAVDPAAFEDVLNRWAEAALAGTGPDASLDRGLEAISLDGKSLRGSLAGHDRAVHLLSAMAQRCGLTLRQAEVDGKTNEHKAALGLLRGLVLEGRVVTGDAMFCQRDLCRQVVDDGGHYFVVVKENQPELLRDIREAFTGAADAAFSPSPAQPHAGAVPRACEREQAERPGGSPPAPGHRPAQRVPGLARGRSGLRDRADGHPR